jgi:hypothetical protein
MNTTLLYIYRYDVYKKHKRIKKVEVDISIENDKLNEKRKEIALLEGALIKEIIFYYKEKI